MIHYIRWASDDPELLSPDLIDAETMEAAIRLTEWFKGETRRVYDMLAESGREAAIRELVEWISSKNNSVTPRETKNAHRIFKSVGDADAALSELVEKGFGTWITVPPSTNGGRPSKRFVLDSAIVSKNPPKSGEAQTEAC